MERRAAADRPAGFLVIDDTAFNTNSHLRLPEPARQPVGADHGRRRLDDDLRPPSARRRSRPTRSRPHGRARATGGSTSRGRTRRRAFDQSGRAQARRSAPDRPDRRHASSTPAPARPSPTRPHERHAYYYAVWTVARRLLSSPRAIAATPQPTPPGPVTNAASRRRATRRSTLTWTNPTGAFDAVKVVRKAGGDPGRPDRRHARLQRHRQTVTDTGLTNGTTYQLRGLGRARRAALEPARASSATPGAAPLDPVTNLPGDGGRPAGRPLVDEPDDAVRPGQDRAQGRAPTRPTRPTAPSSTPAPARASPTPGSTNGTDYHYARLGAALGGQLSTRRARATATPVAPPLVPVTGLQATAGNARVDLSWTNPTIALRPGRRRPQGRRRPGRPTDGTTSTAARRRSLADTGVSNGTSYHYAVCVAARRRALGAPRARPRCRSTRRASSPTRRTPTGAYGGHGRELRRSAPSSTSPIDKALTKLGRVYKAGSTAGNQIGIWDGTTGALLASVNVTPAAPTATLADAARAHGGQAAT